MRQSMTWYPLRPVVLGVDVGSTDGDESVAVEGERQPDGQVQLTTITFLSRPHGINSGYARRFT